MQNNMESNAIPWSGRILTLARVLIVAANVLCAVAWLLVRKFDPPNKASLEVIFIGMQVSGLLAGLMLFTYRGRRSAGVAGDRE